MPRRPIKRISGAGIAALVGGIGKAMGAGATEPIPAGDVPYTDESFDANSQTRFQAKTPFWDSLLGGSGKIAASNLNNQQIIADTQRQLNTKDAIAAEQRDLVNKKDFSQFTNQLGLKTDDLNRTRNNALLAATLANSEALKANPDLLDEELFNENNVQDLAPEYLKKAQVNQLQYGDLLKTKGLEGAPAEIDNTKATTEHLRTPAATKASNPQDNILKIGDGFVDLSKGLFTDVVKEKDPTTGMETGKVKITHYDLQTGKPIIEKQPQGSNTTTPPQVTPAKTGSSSNGLLNLIKGIGSMSKTQEGNNVSTISEDQDMGDGFISYRDPVTGRLKMGRKRNMFPANEPYTLNPNDLLVR